MFRNPRKTDNKHRKFIAGLPCVACLAGGRSQCAHIGRIGMGMKNHDFATVPLCATWPDKPGCHDIQGKNERRFWGKFGGVDRAKELAKSLYEYTGNWEKCCSLIVEWRRKCL